MPRSIFLESGGSLNATTAEYNRITLDTFGKLKCISLRVTGVPVGSVVASASLHSSALDGGTPVIISGRTGKTCGGTYDYASWDFDTWVQPGMVVQVAMWGSTAGTWRIMVEMEVP